jgi:hypothetical protein
MVVWLYSIKRRCSSSALRSVVVRLAAVGVCDDIGVRATVVLCDSASDGSADPHEWLARRLP